MAARGKRKPSHAGNGRDISIPRGAAAGEESQPVRPEDAGAVMPHVSENDVPTDIGVESAPVVAVTTHQTPKHRGARIFGIIIGVIVVLAVMAAGGAYITYQMGLWGDVAVPDVVGMTADEAQASLEEAGFKMESFEEKVDDGYGCVSSMDPQAGTEVRHGSTVTVGIGIQRTMPDVVGMKPDQAKELIHAEGPGTKVKIIREVSVDIPEDTIISTEPEAGSAFKSTQKVKLHVAQALKVPDVKGMQQDEAVATIEELGLTTQVEWRESAENYPTVLETDPLPGTKVEEGSSVTVYVANGGPQDRWHMTEYLQSDPAVVARYLEWQGWQFAYSNAADGVIYSEMWRTDQDAIVFGSEPWNPMSETWWEYGYTESALAAGSSFAGVRMDVTDLSEDAVNEKTVQKYMGICGFDNPQDTCTNKDISLPNKKKFDSGGVSRVCTYGVTGGVTWAILLKGNNDGSVKISLMAMNDAAVQRLTADGGSVCDMIMYRDAYPATNEDS